MGERRTTAIRIDAHLQREIEARKDAGFTNSMNRVLERDLARYYYMLRVAHVEAAKLLSPEEQALIAENLNGSLFDEHSLSLLPPPRAGRDRPRSPRSEVGRGRGAAGCEACSYAARDAGGYRGRRREVLGGGGARGSREIRGRC